MPIVIKKLGQRGGPKGQDKILPPSGRGDQKKPRTKKAKPKVMKKGGKTPLPISPRQMAVKELKNNYRFTKMFIRDKDALKRKKDIEKTLLGKIFGGGSGKDLEGRRFAKQEAVNMLKKEHPKLVKRLTKKASGGKLKMVEKDGKKVPFFAADGKGKMAMGGMMKKKGMKKGGMMKKGYAKGGPVTVRSGDTLSQIAKSKGLTLASLMAANPGIKNANQIRVGQKIKMPTGGAKSRAQGIAKKKGVYGDTSKPVMSALARDTAARKAAKAGKPVSKAKTVKDPKIARKIATTATRLSNLGQVNKNRRANDAAAKASRPASDRKVGPSKTAIAKAAKSASTKPVTTAENQRLAALRAKARKRVDRRAGGGMMKKKGMAKGGMMKKKSYAKGGMMKKKGMAKGGVMRGAGAATRGKRFGRAG